MILIGCEESQVITQGFRKAGFECYSCDIQATRGNPDWHYQRDIMEVIPLYHWDLIILHPDCTRLAVCGNRTYARGAPKFEERLEALDWTLELWDLACKHSDRVALENPASIIFRYLQAPTYYIHPWEHGHPEQKKTGLALHNLPPLKPTNIVYDEMMMLPKAERERVHMMSPGPNRKRDRSETYAGIRDAVVDQWGRELPRCIGEA